MSFDFAFLDSGTGGIPYMQFLKKHYPSAKCVYLADSKHFPYGERSSESVIECALEATDLIIKHWNPKTLIVACNTMSVEALDALRLKHPSLPIVGTVPAIKLASSVTKNKNVGLLATNITVKNAYVKKLIKDFASNCKIFSRGDAPLISFIEHKSFTATKDEKMDAIAPAVKYFKENNCDVIILACTHFTHLAKEIAELAGPSVCVLDSREGVVKQAVKVEQNRKNSDKNLSEEKTLEKNILDQTVFVTGFSTKEDEKKYITLCNSLQIPFGGILE